MYPNSMQMRMKITRATLTPYNEYGISFKTCCTNTDLKHAYLPLVTKMNFRELDIHAHWWSHAKAPIRLLQPNCESPTPPSPTPHTMSKVRTHLTIGELIRKKVTMRFHSSEFPPDNFHIYPELSWGHRLSLRHKLGLLEDTMIDLLPMIQGQKVNPIIRPDIHSPTSLTPLMFTHIYTSHT